MLDPIVGVTYGPSGLGKTLDTLFSFPKAIFFCQRGALKPVKEFCGYEIPTKNVRYISTIQEATKGIQELKPSDPLDVVVDDFTLFANKTWSDFEEQCKGKDQYAAFKLGRAAAFTFRETARNSGRNVILTCHDSVPHLNTKDGRFVRGGPMLPGKLPEELPGMFDLVLRCECADDRPFGWKAVYRCFVSSQYSMKDRDGICGDTNPMNLREIMRAAGYKVHRPPGLEWMDDLVDKVGLILGKCDLADREQLVAAVGKIRQALRKSPQKIEDLRIQNWILRDSYDRLLIKKNREAKANGPESLWGA